MSVTFTISDLARMHAIEAEWNQIRGLRTDATISEARSVLAWWHVHRDRAREPPVRISLGRAAP